MDSVHQFLSDVLKMLRFAGLQFAGLAHLTFTFTYCADYQRGPSPAPARAPARTPARAPGQSSTHVAQARVYYQVTTSG